MARSLTRSITEGMSTKGRRVALDAGAHEIAVDYPEVRRRHGVEHSAIARRAAAGSFSPAELFGAGRILAGASPACGAMDPRHHDLPMAGFAVLLVGSFTAMNFRTWPR